MTVWDKLAMSVINSFVTSMSPTIRKLGGRERNDLDYETSKPGNDDR
jgi:hypothetical protein